MRKFILGIAFQAILFFGSSQTIERQLVGSTGNHSNQLEWSIGEVITETFENNQSRLEQGFNQYYQNDDGVLNVESNDNFLVFPNPFSDQIFIKTNKKETAFTIIGAKGEVLLSGYARDGDQIDLSSLNGGVFYLKTSSQLSKIIKNKKQ